MLKKVRVYFVVFGLTIVGLYSKFVQKSANNDIYLKMIVAAILLYILSYYCEEHIVEIVSKGKCKLNKKYCKK